MSNIIHVHVLPIRAFLKYCWKLLTAFSIDAHFVSFTFDVVARTCALARLTTVLVLLSSELACVVAVCLLALCFCGVHKILYSTFMYFLWRIMIDYTSALTTFAVNTFFVLPALHIIAGVFAQTRFTTVRIQLKSSLAFLTAVLLTAC